MLEALFILVRRDIDIKMKVHWGGRNMKEHTKRTSELVLGNCVVNKEYVPHWRIGESIRSCHLGLFLENRFSIGFHTPGVPYEYWASGRPIVISREIVEKSHIKPYVIEGSNSFIVESSPIDPDELAEVIIKAMSVVERGDGFKTDVDASLMSLGKRHELSVFLEKITS